jgi:hypothetical protein
MYTTPGSHRQEFARQAALAETSTSQNQVVDQGVSYDFERLKRQTGLPVGSKGKEAMFSTDNRLSFNEGKAPSSTEPKSPSQPQSTSYTVKMAVPSDCTHSFKLIKSDTTLVLWNCGLCHSGPHWSIYKCSNCKLETCRPCVSKA